MEFKKLELSGFKSFFDTTNFFIESGLTGIVGPNGCGKSNIVEALRWCMGETSAKSMRGSGMEDVIFSGTSNRPQKNISEVTITIDNSKKQGQGQFIDLDEIQKWCSKDLSDYKLPRRVLILDNLPKNSMGKITKKKIKSLFN